jgi:hypothetical protein
MQRHECNKYSFQKSGRYRYQPLSAWCQAHVGDSGYALSCLARNDNVVQGHQLLGRFPRIRASQAWLTGSWVRAESRQKDGLNWADRWQDPTYPRLLTWDKSIGVDHARV